MAAVGRLFLAAPLSTEVRAGLVAHLNAALEGKPLPGRPVRPENWHLTLRFCGWSEETQYDRVRAFLDEAERGEPFRVSFGALGAFPRPVRATVLWLGLTGGETRLRELAAVTEEAAQAAGFAAEERPFHPHLTLSRLRPHQDLRPLIERVPAFPLTDRIDRLVLFRSHLGRGGARYEELDSFPLD